MIISHARLPSVHARPGGPVTPGARGVDRSPRPGTVPPRHGGDAGPGGDQPSVDGGARAAAVPSPGDGGPAAVWRLPGHLLFPAAAAGLPPGPAVHLPHGAVAARLPDRRRLSPAVPLATAGAVPAGAGDVSPGGA